MSKSSDLLIFGRTQNATQVPFDNSTNGFVSDNVQDAIEEGEARQASIETYVDRLEIMGDSIHRIEEGRTARIVSAGRDFVTIIEGVLVLSSDVKTVIESGSTLRVTQGA